MTERSGATSIAVRVDGGEVVLAFPNPVAWCRLDPQTAFQVGEAIARSAHEARFGTPPDDGQYLAAQVRARITEALRDRLVTRAALMIPSLIEQSKSPGYIAMQLVDTILAEVDR